MICILDFSLSDDEVSPADILVSFVALSQRSLLHLEVGLERSHVTNGDVGSGGGGDEENNEQMISTLNADVTDDGYIFPGIIIFSIYLSCNRFAESYY